jgi:hypothetical protein
MQNQISVVNHNIENENQYIFDELVLLLNNYISIEEIVEHKEGKSSNNDYTI